MRERIVWLDAVKGVGILSIMRVHMLQPMEVVQSMVFAGAVAMFFVLAGFNYSPPENIKTALKAKSMRLLFPYFVYSLFFFLLGRCFSAEAIPQLLGVLYGRMETFSCGGGEDVTFLSIGNAPMWFLPAMFVTYCWLYLIPWNRVGKFKNTIVCLGLVAVSAVCCYCPIRLPWSVDASFYFAVLVMIGVYAKSKFFVTKWWVFIVALGAWLGVWYYLGNGNISLGEYGRYGAFSMIPFTAIVLSETYVLCCIMRFLEKTFVARAFAYLGRHSLRLMCIHLVIYWRVLSVFARFMPDMAQCRPVVIPVALVVILLVNALLDLVIQRIKLYWTPAKYL